MDSPADLWLRSGKNDQRLYHGSTDDIVKELKAWVERRKAHNDVSMDVSWNVFHVADSLHQLSHQLEGVQQRQIPAMMNQITAITAKQMGNLDRKRNLDNEKDRETLLANFFLASLRHRGIRWPQMPCTERTQADACVCAFLGTMDQGFDARLELELLEDSARINRWEAELSRRDAIRAQEIANDAIPGVNTHPIGLVGARLRQEIANDPTISTREAVTNAAHGIMIPGAVDFVMGSKSTGTTTTPSTTDQATRAADENSPPTNNMTFYIADMLGNVNIATGPSSNTAADTPLNKDSASSSSSGHAAATPDIINVAPGSSSSTPADTHDNTNTTVGPSSSTATGAGANDQTLPVMEGQDAGSKISKAKKKREGRKRAKAARAKEAVENSEGSISNDGDDSNGGLQDLVNFCEGTPSPSSNTITPNAEALQ